MRYCLTGMLMGLAIAYSPMPAAQKAAPVVTAQSTQERLERLERRVKSLTEIMLRIDRVQKEMRELRGEVEVQAHALETMRKRQRDLYLDIDQRMSRLSSGPSPSAGAPAGTGIHPPGSSPSAPPAGSATARGKPGAGSSPGRIASRPTPGADSGGEERSYQRAFDLLKQGRYADSIAAFRAFLNEYPAGNYADNAQYWLGEASYVSRDFDAAIVEFEKVITMHPYSAKVPGAMLKTGFIYYERQDWAQARDRLSKLRKKYPSSTESRLALKRLERMRAEGH